MTEDIIIQRIDAMEKTLLEKIDLIKTTFEKHEGIGHACIYTGREGHNPAPPANKNLNTFSLSAGFKLPHNAPKWLIWIVFGIAMALAGKLSEAIELFKVSQ